MAVPPFPGLPPLLSANLEVRRRLQELQPNDAAEMEAGGVAPPAHGIVWLWPWATQALGFTVAAADPSCREGVGGRRAGSPKGPRAGGQHGPCAGTGRARGRWRYRALGGQGGCEKRFAGSWGGGLALLERRDRDAVTQRAVKAERAERASVG